MLNFIGKEVELYDLLKAKEIRRSNQLLLLSSFSDRSVCVLCFTVVMPGKVKQNSVAELLFKAGLMALEKQFHSTIIKKEIYTPITGSEALFLLKNISPETAKKNCIKLEESNTWARLWDFDILNKSGQPVTREELNINERKCLICDKNSRVCYKKRTHSIAELQEKVLKLAQALQGEINGRN